MSASQVEVASEFMENYRYGTPFVNDTQIAVVGGAGDAQTVFSIASGGHLYMISPDPTSDTGWSAVDLNTEGGEAFAGSLKLLDVATDSGGRPYLAAVVATVGDPSSDSLYYIEDFTPSPTLNRWVFCGRTSQTNITAVSINVLDGQAPVAVMTTVDNATGTSLFQAVTLAAAQTPAPWWAVPTSVHVEQPLAAAVANASGSQNIWLSYLDAGGTAHVDNLPATEPPADGPNEISSLTSGETFTRLTVAKDAAGDDVLFGAAGSALWFDDPNLGMTQLGSTPAPVAQLVAVRDATSTFDVFALTSDSRLYHAVQGREDPEEILQQVAHVAAGDSTDGTQALFSVALNNTLQAASVDRQTGDWSQSEVDVVVDRTVETIMAYSTVLTFNDAAMAPAVFTDVQITSSALTGVYLNGESYALDPTTPLTATTNAAGQVVLTTTTNSLATATISVTADFLPGDHSVELQQNADIQSQLETITATDLLAAEKADGTKLLQGQYASSDVATALQQALNNTMSLASPPPPPPPAPRAATNDASTNGGAAPAAALRLRNVKTRVGIYRTEPVTQLGALHLPAVPAQHWELELTSGLPVFREHTADSISAHVDAITALDSGGGSWSWGDLWDAVESGVIELGHLFVSTVLDPAKKFVENVVAKIVDLAGNVLWAGAVSLLEQAFDLAEGIFNTVKVFFTDLYQWLAFLFNWDDILRTKKAIEHSFEQFIPFIQGAVESVKNESIGYLQTLQGDITSYFNTAITNLGGQTILGKQQADENPDDDVRATSPHNIAFTGFINNAGQAPVPYSGTPPLSQEVLGTLESLVTTLSGYTSQWQSVQAFENALTYFSQIGEKPDQFLELAISGLLSIVEGIALLALDVAETVLGLIFDAVNLVLDGVLQLLQAPWGIPWVSDLYSTISGGGTLCTLDLVSLIIAIPGTVLYKVMFKTAPFPADADEATFESAFTTQALLQASGIASVPAAQAASVGGGATQLAVGDSGASDTTSPYRALFRVFWCINEFLYGAFEAIVDIVPPDPVPGGFQPSSLSPKMQGVYTQFGDAIGGLSLTTWIMEWTSQLFCLPWVAGDGGGVGCSDDTELANLIWILHFIGAGYDTIWYFVTRFSAGGKGRIARNAGDIGVYVDTAYGACDLGLQFWWASVNGWDDGVTISQNFFMTLPEFTKFARVLKVVEATEGFSLPALAACDLIGDWTALGLGLANVAK